MKTEGKYQPFQNIENQTISRFLLIVLIALGAGCILSAIQFPEVAWVLLICFLYLLTLEIILLTSN